jgi:transposase
MNKLNATHSLDDHDFGELAKTESKARARTRLYILHQYRIGKQSHEIAENLNINIETARRTRRRYQASGLDSLYDKPRSGRNSKLASEYIDAFKQLIVETQAKRGGGRLTGQDIQKLAYEHYQVTYSVNGIYELLGRIGMTWISARSQHPQADINAQEAFKKTS